MPAAPPPFRLIVGLGNPGREYERTRHNAGFMVLDRLLEKLAAGSAGSGSAFDANGALGAFVASFASSPPAPSAAPFFSAAPIVTGWRAERAWKAQVATSTLGGSTVVYCKPTSYMNLSGQPVGAVARFYKAASEQVLVVYDDLALPLGKLRLRTGGSAGGHNGMQSIIERMGTPAIPRLRVGIGGVPGGKGSGMKNGMVGHVLGRFAPDELPVLEEALDNAVAALLFIQKEGFSAAMNRFN